MKIKKAPKIEYPKIKKYPKIKTPKMSTKKRKGK